MLQMLRLAHNRLHGVPMAFGTLNKLDVLDLARNEIRELTMCLFALQRARINVYENPLSDVWLVRIYRVMTRPNYTGSPLFTGVFATPEQIFFPKRLEDTVVFWLKLFHLHFPQEQMMVSPEHLDPSDPIFNETYKGLLNARLGIDIFRHFLRAMCSTKAFCSCPASERSFIYKVHRMIEGSTKNPNFKKEMLERMDYAVSRGEEAISASMHAIDVLWVIHMEIEKLSTPEEKKRALAELLIGFRRVELLHACALRRAAELGILNGINASLYYQVVLKERLHLPLSVPSEDHPIAPSGLTQAMLEEDAQHVMDATSDKEQLVDILMNHDAWQRKMRTKNLRTKTIQWLDEHMHELRDPVIDQHPAKRQKLSKEEEDA